MSLKIYLTYVDDAVLRHERSEHRLKVAAPRRQHSLEIQHTPTDETLGSGMAWGSVKVVKKSEVFLCITTLCA